MFLPLRSHSAYITPQNPRAAAPVSHACSLLTLTSVLQVGSAIQDGTRSPFRSGSLALHRGCRWDGGLPQEVCEKGSFKVARFLDA